jgi:hypothetical protein
MFDPREQTMPTIPLQAHLSTDDLIRAVDQFTPGELEDFVRRVLALRARRQVRSLPAVEATLLQRINQGLTCEQQDRYVALIGRRDARALTAQEQEELLRLTDQVEQAEADRAAALVELAQLRQVTVAQLLHDLGIQPNTNG